MRRIELEKRLISKMISLYCKRKHRVAETCQDCTELRDYSLERLDRCPFGDSKSSCNDCRIHCYRKDKQAEVKRVMRFAGPRMLFSSPILTLRYFLAKILSKRRAK